ncbi:hypothetical protein JF546_09760 [Nitratireductor aquimarinus]|uniref:VpaChn25_0724 family phage protein n=1 Tax=Nitratireductor aquimarinus TaxID=889300 RepID=UPI001A8C1964|nr:hypothetical protein [Nitratireductor aquimarinus]MBN8243295.1 hypothetical protein [Nitratireductor aquimarinus]MBY6131196.1 hypothetical protein [Nitratireductor aquimarinus]MCA1302048.1 hypothetical protein [Nitratireductor aquimarinus]
MNYAAFAKADARLIILKELSRQTDGRMNETMLTSVLDTFGHRRSRDWVRTQLRALEELGTVNLVEAGTVLIASISRAGLDHVERRTVIEGIAKPSPEH